MIFAKLVTHNDGALCGFSTASLKISVVERRTLQIKYSRFKFGIFQDLIKFFGRGSASHDDNIGVGGAVIFMKTFFKEVIDGILLTISKQQYMLGLSIGFSIVDPTIFRR